MPRGTTGVVVQANWAARPPGRRLELWPRPLLARRLSRSLSSWFLCSNPASRQWSFVPIGSGEALLDSPSPALRTSTQRRLRKNLDSRTALLDPPTRFHWRRRSLEKLLTLSSRLLLDSDSFCVTARPWRRSRSTCRSAVSGASEIGSLRARSAFSPASSSPSYSLHLASPCRGSRCLHPRASGGRGGDSQASQVIR